MSFGLALLVALVIDRWWGEPPLLVHPVVWMGRYLGWIGGLIAPRTALPSPNWQAFTAGALAWYGGAMLCGLAAWLLQSVVLKLHPVLAGLLLGLLLKPMLAWRMLRDEVAGVEQGLAESLDAGRRRLGRIVSREVMRLDASQVRESAIESLAENLNDSVVAPVFWFVVAGLPGAMVYRFCNTADAMWGYRGFRAGVHWEWAGKWAARADDVLSWIPARFTALLVAVAAGGISLARLRGDAHRTPSPNSGWPMSAMALALNVRLRKPGVYALNEGAPAPAAADTGKAIALSGGAILLLGGWAAVMLAALGWGRTW
ncbi:adenosylcobinamide-phosphate synthase CbiB [Caenimonas sedimenti]|uniref:adenosylcobinamide-phosphate synthase CbiB n=1 Tax=Caenimonas sedimenti TaxID=2596921 RepID=UPI0021075DD0|nr:adenosylcobinamide-phosphate synthase CbiB [Caenimonas sedimenti]